MKTYSQEVSQGDRYQFGRNWQRFLCVLNEDRVSQAEASLKAMLQLQDLAGKSFLDVGSGSGLFSLAAMRLGASRVHSFDYDPHSVACTKELKRRFFPDAGTWTIDEASVLDRAYVSSLGKFDIVYSWGVLHHTGDMWNALENAVLPVRNGGNLFIAIYNDQGSTSKIWKAVKTAYNRSWVCRAPLIPLFVSCVVANGLARDLVAWKNPFSRYRSYEKRRGMSFVPDVLDWLGGYPFEVAKPSEVTEFCAKRGFTPVVLTVSTGSGRGNNQYVFVRGAALPPLVAVPATPFQEAASTNL